MPDRAPAQPSAEAERRRKADLTRPPGACQPPPATPPAWIDPCTGRAAGDRLDQTLSSWMQHLVEAVSDPRPQPAALDAAAFAAAVLFRLPDQGRGLQLPERLALHAAIDLRNTAAAQAIKAAIDQHNLRGQALPDHLREYVAQRQQTGTDYTRRPRGGDLWRHAGRDRALTREAYDWRLIHHDWRHHHSGLAKPAACLRWTANELTETLDCIAEYFGTWPTNPPDDQQFFPSNELCADYGLPVGDDQDALLHRIYPGHFRGLLIGHVAALCLDEWERRIAVGPELP